MKTQVKQFIAGAFALIGLFLVLTHASGFARDVGAGGNAIGGTFKVLQGR